MGRAVAECFAAEGARVVVLARGQQALDETVGVLAELGSPDAFAISVDVTDRSGVDRSFAEIGERWGALNALVNASGPGSLYKPWQEVRDHEWLAFFDALALGAVRATRAALPLLRAAEWARVVNLCAMSIRSHGFGLAEYTAAKSALSSITKNQSLELAPDGILVNAVSPGTFASSMVIDYLTGVDADDRPERPRDDRGAPLPAPDDLPGIMRMISDQYGVRCDLGRAGDPSEIAPPIVFLASRRNTYTTGANLNVDGGSAFVC